MAASVAFQPMASSFVPAPASSATVTLNRSSFEILIRRANLNHNAGFMESSLPRHQNVESIFVSKAEHDSLLVTASRYACLQRHLLEGGVSQETISLLSENAASVTQVFPRANSPVNQKREYPSIPEQDHKREQQAPSSSHQCHSPQGNLPTLEEHTASMPLQRFEPILDWSEAQEAEISDTGPDSLAPAVRDIDTFAPAPEQASFGPHRPHFAKTCQRSLAISKLPDNCTLADVTAVLRGGLLLSLHHRPVERCAFVSFLHEEHAVGFLEHVKKNGLYIRNKSVAVHWADRQYYLQGHTAYQIRGGATRNLVIRRCDPRHTEASVRDDLEHIHNLVAIKIEFMGGSCFIKTNSVMNAIFARTCMMSRVKYKGSSITFDTDECAQPLEVLPAPSHLQKNSMAQAVGEPRAKTQNRFAALRVDDEDDHEESFTDDDQDNSDYESVSPVSSASTDSDKCIERA